jgi:hypothetical protein
MGDATTSVSGHSELFGFGLRLVGGVVVLIICLFVLAYLL